MRAVNKPFTVYMHISPNNKRYIGITSQTLIGRTGSDGSKYSLNEYFWRAIQKYGWNNFEHIIVAENLSQDEACKMEIELIAKYQSNNPKYGYNLSLGGDLGNYNRHCSTEAKRKISEKNSGRIMSEESKQKISNTLKGRKHSAEHNKKVSEALKGKYVGELSSTYGKKQSAEARKHKSEGAKLGWERRRAKLNGNK